MSFIKHFLVGERNVIYKDAKNHENRLFNYKNRVLEGGNLLIVGTVGSGKSVLALTLAQTYYENKCTVINLTNKSRSEWDNAFGIFSINKKFHEQQIIKYGRVPWTKNKCLQTVKFWCPYSSRGIQKRDMKELPKVNFYTHSLKSLTEDVIATIMSVEGDKTYVKAAYNVLNELKKSSSLRNFIFECSKQLSSNVAVEEQNDDENNFLVLPEHKKLLGDTRTAQSIKDSFKEFIHDDYLMPDSWLMNINMIDILNDNKHIHFFIDYFLTHPKSKYVNLVLLLELIRQALGTGLVKHHVVIIFEEIKILLPNKNIGYIIGLEEIIIDILSSIRSAGKGVTTIGTTQVFGETSQRYRSLCNEVYLGRLSAEDIKLFKRDFSISMGQQRVLEHLSIGEFVHMGRFFQHDGFVY